MKLNHFSKTVVGLVRKANEDCIGNIATPNKSNINLRIVCDGMGGHIGGAKASNIAVKSIKEYFSNTPNPVPQVALNEAIVFANMQIFGFAQAEPEFNGMGTTCTVLLESEGLIYIAHVGDSRIYIHTDKKLYRITKDHSYVQGLVDKGEITDQQMETHPNKNQLTRALGIAAEVEVEVASKPILAKTNDSFLLCSDGLNGLINDRMINSVINTDSSLETKCNNLITMAEAAGGHDNISVDLIEVLESDHTTTQFLNKNNEDLIDTSTQQILPNTQIQEKTSLWYLKNKVSVSLIVASILLVPYFGYQMFFDDSDIPEMITVVKADPLPKTKTDTIKVIVEKGWGVMKLNSEFETKVNEKVGAENYCRDCPVYYKKGSDKPISIYEYRKNVKNLGLGDFLLVYVTDGKVDMPEINKNGKIEEKEPTNQFSEEIKKQQERLKQKRLEKERIKKQESDAKKKKSEIEKSDLDTTDTEIVEIKEPLKVKSVEEATETKQEKKEKEKEKQEKKEKKKKEKKEKEEKEKEKKKKKEEKEENKIENGE
jgi:serine/threonine protein phosphatase PrpC